MEPYWIAALLGVGGMAWAVYLSFRKYRRGTDRAEAVSSRRHVQREKAEGGASPGLQGNLEQTPMHDLFQFIALGKRTGTLQVASGRRAGSIVFLQGAIVRSLFRGKEGLEAAFHFLDLKDGDFEFQEQKVDVSDSAPVLEVVDVIMVWMSRTAERHSSP